MRNYFPKNFTYLLNSSQKMGSNFKFSIIAIDKKRYLAIFEPII